MSVTAILAIIAGAICVLVLIGFGFEAVIMLAVAGLLLAIAEVIRG